MLRLNNLSSPKGAIRKNKRLGRGEGSGQGQRAGKGDKGQNARAGGGVRLGFEGGQTPLYRRLPKKGFSNAPFKKSFAIVNIGEVAKKFEAGEVVSRETLIQKGFLKGINKRNPVKVLGNGEFQANLSFEGISHFSQTARTLIEKNGGSIKDTASES